MLVIAVTKSAKEVFIMGSVPLEGAQLDKAAGVPSWQRDRTYR
jgi:hypothetical protein